MGIEGKDILKGVAVVAVIAGAIPGWNLMERLYLESLRSRNCERRLGTTVCYHDQTLDEVERNRIKILGENYEMVIYRNKTIGVVEVTSTAGFFGNIKRDFDQAATDLEARGCVFEDRERLKVITFQDDLIEWPVGAVGIVKNPDCITTN